MRRVAVQSGELSWLRRRSFANPFAAQKETSMSQAREKALAQTSQLRVNGVNITYLEQGTGTPAVFVHGAFSDLRFWEPQRQAVAANYRFIALTQRYFGSTPWPDGGSTMRRPLMPPIWPRSCAS